MMEFEMLAGYDEAKCNGATAQAQGHALDQMTASARRASDFLKALSHEHRLLLLCLLTEKERSVRELETLLDLRQAAVSQQLARLRQENLVAARREGKTVYYSIADESVRRVIAVVYDIFCGEGAGGDRQARPSA